MKKEYHILNLGCGVQSTTLYLMGMRGELPDGIEFDCAVFADPKDEGEDVYKHLEWLKSLGGTEIKISSAGHIGEDIKAGVNTTGQKFVSIPAFTKNLEIGKIGQIRRQCTREYKIDVVERVIRRDILGLKKYQRVPKDVIVWQYVGFSYDEPGRAARARGRFEQRGWTNVRFPLIEDRMTRHQCVMYLEDVVPHTVPRSACVFCPYKSNREWKQLKQHDKKGWARAVEIDRALRSEAVLNRNPGEEMYIHRTCKPLEDCYFDEDQMDLFDLDCEGGCGL